MILNPAVAAQLFLQDYRTTGVGPNSIDLHVNKVFQIDGGVTLFANGGRVLPYYSEIEPRDSDGLQLFTLHSGRTYQVEFQESVNLPLDVCGMTLIRSTMGKSGASGECSLYDSGYSGNTGMTISVNSTSTIEKGASIAQMLFFRAEASKSYDGFYQSRDWIQTSE